MLDATLISSLPKLEPPILTAYLDTNPASPSNQGQPSGARIWLKSQAKALQANLPRPEQMVVRKQLEPVDRFLETGRSVNGGSPYSPARRIGACSDCK
jgi:hypothetical protein